jgi:hypothetical protein
MQAYAPRPCLTKQNKYATERADLIQRHLFHVQLAKEEHKYLADTLRQRLAAQLSNKRNRLLREKEQLDLGDSNALLLHPNQFSITNPSSPGGGHKRATRNTGRRGGGGGGGDPDDSGMPQDRRKRKVYSNDDHDGHSPTPGPGARGDGSGATSAAAGWRDGRPGRSAHHQYEAATYSVDRLFTDKELMMAMNHASVAATNFLIRNQPGGDGGATNGAPADAGADDKAPSDEARNSPPDGTSTPAAAPEMDRSLSATAAAAAHTHHQTRGATRSAAELAAELQALAAARDHPNHHAAHAPASAALPTYVPAVPGSKANGAAAATAPLASAEVDADLARFAADDAPGDEWAAQLGRALDPVAPMEYHFCGPVLGRGRGVSSSAAAASASGPASGNASSGPAGGAGLLAVASAAAAASGPASVAGGEPMSRQASGAGAGMRRTASGAGSAAGGAEGGRRVRTRLS